MNTLSKNLLLLYILLKPYYLFSSGGLQIADLFLIASLLTYAFSSVKNNHKALISSLLEHRLLAIFTLFTILINLAYFSIYPERKFVLSSLYYIFTLSAVVIFSISMRDKYFLSRMLSVFKLNLVIQFVLWTVSLGVYYDSTRYMSTFNDPNQFGYYILISLLFIFTISHILKRKTPIIHYTLVIFMIFLSGSTGMLLGVTVFFILLLLILILRFAKSSRSKIGNPASTLSAIIVFLSALPFIYINLLPDSSNSNSYTLNSTIIKRATSKINKSDTELERSLIEDRGLDTIIKYPRYILYGSGEGNYGRFTEVTNYKNEIHSTLPSILFYYGAIPTLILLLWIANKLKGTSTTGWVVMLTLFTTSFILLNQRQALFWVLIILVSMHLRKTPKFTTPIVNKNLNTYHDR